MALSCATTFAERTRRAGTPLAGASLLDLDVVLDDWSILREVTPPGSGPAEDDAASVPRERLIVRANDPGSGIGIDLVLEASKPLVLHGKQGYSAKGLEPGNASAYASWTRLTTRGSVMCGGVERSVQGSSWFDHEHGSSVLGADVVGWDWFGLQLDDGRELMLFGLREADGSLAASSGGTLVGVDGKPRALGRDDFSWQVGARWQSPRTEATYPAQWTLRIPDAGLELELTPRVADCELVTEESTGVVYWEGPVAVGDLTSGP